MRVGRQHHRDQAARVRFENNYDLAAYPNINQRAVVPKILVWSIWL
ncbi:MAG: hypothetical protein R2711_10665 [Acidimicrobiales bacterium]